MTAVWADGLPQRPLFQGFSNPYPNRLLTTAMDSGDDKTRRRGPKPRAIDVYYAMTNAQIIILEAFCSDTIMFGAHWFDWPHPILDRYVRSKIVPSDAQLYSQVPYNNTLKWLIGMTIKYWPDAPLT